MRGWLEERTGWASFLGRWLGAPIEGGARFTYVLGSVALFLLICQAASGVLLACYYSPSTGAAWASVAYIQDQVRLGWLVRGLHSAGASALIVVVALHVLQTAWFGAYRKPREVTWLVGVSLLATTFACALTGYLLPWDQKGYWATQVVTSLAGALPLVGRTLSRLAVGGETYGNLTLTRFYALHVLLLPAAALLLVPLHVALFRRHGVTRRAGRTRDAVAAEPFWPGQAVRDLAAALLAAAAVVVIVVVRHGVSLEGPADAAAAYAARPEWYFRPLYVVLKLLPPSLETAGMILIPLGLLALLLALPWLDRSRRSWTWSLLVAGLGAGALALGLASWIGDARSPSFQAERRAVEAQARRARDLARRGVPAAGGLAVFDNDPVVVAKRLFGLRCATCHELGGQGERNAPRLDGWAGRPWTAGVMRDPGVAEYYGTSGVSGMKPLRAPESTLAAIAEYLFAQGGSGQVDENMRARGEKLFADQGCGKCHAMDGRKAGDGPNLAGWGSASWMSAFLRDPGAPRFYGKQNRMPRMGERLEAGDIEALAQLLAGARLSTGDMAGTDMAGTRLRKAKTVPWTFEAAKTVPWTFEGK